VCGRPLAFCPLTPPLRPPPPQRGSFVALGMLWCGLHSLGRLNVQTLLMLLSSFDFWLPVLMMAYFFVALLDMMDWKAGQVIIIISCYLSFFGGLAADAYSFRRSKATVLNQIFLGLLVFATFCTLAHFDQLKGLDTAAQHDVGGLRVSMLETASSRALASFFLWARLFFVVARKPHEAGMLRCPMRRTMLTSRMLAELKSRGQPPQVYPSAGMAVDEAGSYRSA
jgi:hypothetical protein